MAAKNFKKELSTIEAAIREQRKTKRKILRNLDCIVLDNSIREATVGQLRGHTLENKIKIYQETKKCGFEYYIVASFNHMTRVGDTFCEWLRDNNEDRSKLFSFSEVTEGIKNGIPDTEQIPISMRKCKTFGIPNVIIEIDLADPNIDWKKFTVQHMCSLLEKRLNWCYDNLSKDSKVMVNFRDFAFAMKSEEAAIRLLTTVDFMSSLSNRGWGFCIEEPGKFLPEEVGAWCAAIRSVMDSCNWKDGNFFAHVHKKWGFATLNQLECLMNGANGIWAAVCEEGASVGHASSTTTLMNLIRMGNKKVLKKYNCKYLRQAAINVTSITTGAKPPSRELVYGERALDIWLPGGIDSVREFDLGEFFGEEAPNRITDLSSLTMIINRLTNLFGSDPQFNEETALKMKELLLDDMSNNRKEEYMSEVGVALLFDRAGGKLTPAMRDVIEQTKLRTTRDQKLIDEVRAIWDEWDVRETERKDNRLLFYSFYNGFMSPYFGCYQCDDAKRGLKALDMDMDGYIDWSEFLVYLKWALRQYPSIKNTDELLSCAFRKGLIPAMQDIVLKQHEAGKAKS